MGSLHNLEDSSEFARFAIEWETARRAGGVMYMCDELHVMIMVDGQAMFWGDKYGMVSSIGDVLWWMRKKRIY